MESEQFKSVSFYLFNQVKNRFIQQPFSYSDTTQKIREWADSFLALDSRVDMMILKMKLGNWETNPEFIDGNLIKEFIGNIYQLKFMIHYFNQNKSAIFTQWLTQDYESRMGDLFIKKSAEYVTKFDCPVNAELDSHQSLLSGFVANKSDEHIDLFRNFKAKELFRLITKQEDEPNRATKLEPDAMMIESIQLCWHYATKHNASILHIMNWIDHHKPTPEKLNDYIPIIFEKLDDSILYMYIFHGLLTESSFLI